MNHYDKARVYKEHLKLTNKETNPIKTNGQNLEWTFQKGVYKNSQ